MIRPDDDPSTIPDTPTELYDPDERLKAAMQSLLDCFAIYSSIRDHDGRLVDFRIEAVNDPGCHSHHMVREQMVGRALLEVLPEYRESGLFDAYCKVVETGETFEATGFAYATTRGHRELRRMFDIRAVRLGDGFAAAWRDATENLRKAAERAEGEDLFRSLADSSPVIIWMTDAEGVCRFINDRWMEFTGQSLEEALGTGWLDAVHEEDRLGASQVFRAAIEKPAPFRLEYRLRHRDGAYRWFLDAGMPRFDDSGQFLGHVGSVVDIDDQKRSESAVRISEERLRLAIEATGLGTFDWDLTTGELRWCEQTRRLFGVNDRSDVDIHLFYSRLHPEDRARVHAILDAAVDPDGPGLYHADYRVVHADGTTRWASARGKVLFDQADDGQRRPLRLVGAALDLTDRIHAENALREADRRKTEFLATLAHELRNPLGAIRNAQQLASRGHDLTHALQVIDRQSRHLGVLIDDLLDLARIDQGKISLRRSRMRLLDAVRAAAASVRPIIDENHHVLSIDPDGSSIEVDGDPNRLEQIVSNLLSNAAKYTPPGGRIDVRLTRDDGSALLAVHDNGEGILPEMLPRIFEMFAQIDRTLDRSRGGLGIGLTLVRQLVELHGGQIDAQSAGPGQGSTFTVRLPLASSHAPLEAASGSGPERPGTEPPLAPLRIFIADDNRDAAETMAMLLQMLGHEIALAYNGRDAVEQIPDFRPDAAFLDLSMPGLSGYQVAEHLRARSQPVLLVALSGYAQDSDRQRTRAAGFDAHLVKPVELPQLNELLAGLARRHV
jgi:PAS domain S-box-containing protein